MQTSEIPDITYGISKQSNIAFGVGFQRWVQNMDVPLCRLLNACQNSMHVRAPVFKFGQELFDCCWRYSRTIGTYIANVCTEVHIAPVGNESNNVDLRAYVKLSGKP